MEICYLKRSENIEDELERKVDEEVCRGWCKSQADGQWKNIEYSEEGKRYKREVRKITSSESMYFA